MRCKKNSLTKTLRLLALYLGATGGLLLSCARASAQSHSDALLRQGDASGDAGDVVAARDSYERAIVAGAGVDLDAARARRLGEWYMDGEPHDYAKAAEWLSRSLQANPADFDARWLLAKVLSWDRQYARSVGEYRQLLAVDPGNRELNLQLARVLSWSGRYRESLSMYDALLSSQPTDDVPRVERARVLSWVNRYTEAVREYDLVLKRDPKNMDARIGRAQVLYWSGNTWAAAAAVRGVLQADPRNASASFLMAALYHSEGMDSRALDALGHSTPDGDTSDLRNSILRDQRPVLHLRVGYDDDRESPTAAAGSTYRALRYGVSFGFNLNTNLRMEVANTVTQNSTSTPVLGQFGRDALATQTVARLSFSPQSWLRMTIGGGDATTGAGNFGGVTAARAHHFVYELTPTMTFGNLRLDFAATRGIADYTPLAVHDSLVLTRESVSAAYTWGHRVRFGGDYWHGDYGLNAGRSLSTSANGGSANLYPVLYRRDRLNVEAGVRYEAFGFADDTLRIVDPTSIGSAGVFMPRLYERYAGVASLSLRPRKGTRLELEGSYGPQRVFRFAATDAPAAWGNTGSIGSKFFIALGEWEPYIEASYFSTATPASPGLRQGSYAAYGLAFGLRHRF